jgi:hypothetical protein
VGQYYKVINLDKKQYLHPHRFGDGLKLMEFGMSSCGTMAALAILLSDGNGRGRGDIRSQSPLVGSWAGDRVVISGDYSDKAWKDAAEAGRDATNGVDKPNLYGRLTEDGFEDISAQVRAVFTDAGEEIGGTP